MLFDVVDMSAEYDGAFWPTVDDVRCARAMVWLLVALTQDFELTAASTTRQLRH